jgi:hypothetical protein
MHWLEGMTLWANLMEVDEKYRNRLISEHQKFRVDLWDIMVNESSCGHREHMHPLESPVVSCRKSWLSIFRDLIKYWGGMTEWNPTGKWDRLQSPYILDLSDADYLDVEEAVVSFWMQYSIEQYGIYLPESRHTAIYM